MLREHRLFGFFPATSLVGDLGERGADFHVFAVISVHYEVGCCALFHFICQLVSVTSPQNVTEIFKLAETQ